MRRILVVLAALVLPASARAETTAYVDTLRVRGTATEPSRMDAQFQADQQVRNQKTNESWQAAQKAKPADRDAAVVAARKVQEDNAAAIKRHAEEVDGAFLKRLTDVLTKLRAERHVAIAAGPGLLMVPGVNLTDEVIARMNAADNEGMAAALAKARAELAAKEAQPPPPSTARK